MTSITQLIAAVAPHIPFANEAEAQAFLDQFNVSDQAALITAMYIGRDHIHNTAIQPDYASAGYPLDRFFHTGDASRWLISPSGFANILREKESSLFGYFDAFQRCMPASALASF